jgi:hypothetical protein
MILIPEGLIMGQMPHGMRVYGISTGRQAKKFSSRGNGKLDHPAG